MNQVATSTAHRSFSSFVGGGPRRLQLDDDVRCLTLSKPASTPPRGATTMKHIELNVILPEAPLGLECRSQSTHAQRERAETFVAKINVIVYHDVVLDRGF